MLSRKVMLVRLLLPHSKERMSDLAVTIAAQILCCSSHEAVSVTERLWYC